MITNCGHRQANRHPTSPYTAYDYGADGARVHKQNADNTFTEYVDFLGSPIAEKDQTGAWTDYIFADGKRIALAPSAESVFQLSGHSNSYFTSSYTNAAHSLVGYSFQPGDVLLVRQRQVGATGSIRI